MKSSERKRLVAGALFLVASVATGAVTGEWTPAAELAPDVSLQPTTDAAAPAARTAIEEAAALPAAATTALPVPDAARPVVREPEPVEEPLLVLEGGASWYSDALAGRATASGEPYDPSELIAAHRALPFGTRLRVTNLANDRSVEVTVIDRGPFIAGRIVDLSRSAAEQIGMIRAGHARVRVEILEYGG